MKKVQLERVLQSLEAVPTPRPDIEQYATPAGIAADVAYIAHAKGDIADESVIDLGCGNGVLAVAAKLLGAARAMGVDMDPEAIRVARRNARVAGVEVEWIQADVGQVEGRFDTVLMNPPFGSQTKHADLPFLEKASRLGRVVYSFHNGVTEPFVVRWITSHGGQVTDRVPYAFPLPHAFSFQTQEVRRIPVVLLRTVPAKD